MQPPLHREHRQARLLSHAAERDVEDAIKAEYEANGLPMPWDEMAKRILALEKQVNLLTGMLKTYFDEGPTAHFHRIDEQLASLEDRFTALLDQATAHEKELSAHQTALDCLRFDLDKTYLSELQALKELVQKQASDIASLDRAVRNLSDYHI